MTDDPMGELPRVSRDIAVTARPERDRLADATSFGVLEPFPGLLEGRVERGRPPLPDMSYLTLAPLVAAAHARGDTSGSAAGRPDRPPSRTSREGTGQDSDADGEPTVSELLDGEASGDEPAGHDVHDTELDRTLVDTPDGLESTGEVGRSTGDGTANRRGLSGSEDGAASGHGRPGPDDGTPSQYDPSASGDEGGPARDASGQPAPSLTTVDRRQFVDRTVRGDRSGIGQPVPGARGDDATAGGSRRGVIPPAMTLSDPAGGATGSRSGRQSGSSPRPGRPDRTGSGDAGGDGPRLTVQSATDSGTDVDTRATGNDRDDGGTSEGSPVDRETAESLAGRANAGDPSSVLAESADPESRLVDRLYRALQEREAIERRRRGGR